MSALKIAVREEPKYQPGELLGDKFQILDLQAKCAFGEVYVCRHLDLPNLLLSVMLVDSEVASSKSNASRLWNDLQNGYLVSHRDVVRYFSHHIAEQGMLVVREYLDGETVSSLVRPLPLAQALLHLSQIARGLEAIHDAGIIHCDVKAENVQLSRDGAVAKLGNFEWAMTQASPLSWPGVAGARCEIALTPEYISARRITKAGDIFCLGLLAYQMVTGSRPVPTPELASPASVRHSCPRKLSDVIMRCLARATNERYQCAREAAEEFDKVRRSLTITCLRPVN